MTNIMWLLCKYNIYVLNLIILFTACRMSWKSDGEIEDVWKQETERCKMQQMSSQIWRRAENIWFNIVFKSLTGSSKHFTNLVVVLNDILTSCHRTHPATTMMWFTLNKDQRAAPRFSCTLTLREKSHPVIYSELLLHPEFKSHLISSSGLNSLLSYTTHQGQ